MNRSNTIYYKFKSEKKKYAINFDTTEISIGDIKNEIIKRRNIKGPDKIELIFYDENSQEIRDDNYKVEPLKLLVIRRIPWYKLSSTFIECIKDPNEIGSLRFNDIVVSVRKTANTMVNYIDPIEKIQPKINKDLISNAFSCKLCKSLENDDVILLCCGETICEKCAIEKIVKVNENGVLINKCILCKENYKEYMPNKKLKDMKERILNVLNKQNLQILNNFENENMNIEEIDVNTAANKPKLPILVPVNQNVNNTVNQNDPANEINPHMNFFENCRFFIIKSSNKENVDLSQKYSEWATTVTNQKKLNEAFQNNNVILIFSVNKSGSFQGYAIMTSFIGDKVSSIWQNESSVKLGGSFSIQWICTCEMQFSKVKSIVNPINNNEFVIKSRDTQELPRDIGLLLCNYCYDQEKFESTYKNSKPPFFDTETTNRIFDDIKKSRESK